MQRVVGSALALCLVAWPLAAAAQIVPVSQTRTVSVEADQTYGPPDSETVSAPDFGPFDVDLLAESLDPIYGVFGAVRAAMSQASSIGPNGLSVGGGGSVYLVYAGLSAGTGSASSVYDIVFDVTEVSSFTMSADGIITGPGIDQSVTLSDENGPIETLGWYGSATGTLFPGRYRFEYLQESTRMGFDQFDGQYWFEATLNLTLIPEPGTASLLGLGLAMLAAPRRAGTGSDGGM